NFMTDDITQPLLKKRYAGLKNRHIAAIVDGLFRFKTEEKAMEKLVQLSSLFIASTRETETPDPRSLTLWIRDFALTEEEAEKGYMGHFGHIQVVPLEGGLFTLSIARHEAELKFHPLRKRTAQRAPNWGHPILRSIQKGK